MKLNVILIFLAATCFFSNETLAGAEQNTTRYYTKIVGIISPFIDYTLRGQVTQEQAVTLSHYKVSYDNRDRITEISYFRANIPSEDSYFYAHKVLYVYEDSAISRKYYNKDGEPVSMNRHYYSGGEIHVERFNQTSRGVTLHFFDKSGKAVSTGLNAFKFVMEQVKDGFIQTQYAADGSPVVLTNYFPFEKSLITVDDNGHLESIYNLHPKTGIIENHQIAQFSRVSFSFDRFGNELGWRFLNVNEELVDRPADIIDPGYARWEYTFDWEDKSQGRYSNFEIVLVDKQGDVFCNSSGVCKMKYEYNLFGEFVGQSFYNSEGDLISDSESGFAKLTIMRDSLGKIKERRYQSASGDLIRSTDSF